MKTNKTQKIKILFAISLLILSFVLVSCGKNETNDSFKLRIHDHRVKDVLYPKGSKLKRVFLVSSDGSKSSAEYSYNNLERISRVDVDNGRVPKYYYLYLYNEEGQLEELSSYREYPEVQPILDQTIVFSYDSEGNKLKEQTELDTKLFYYSGKTLVKQECYSYYSMELISYIEYEYENNNLVREEYHLLRSRDHSTTEYFYKDGLLVYSITYRDNPESGIQEDARRYYDLNDNLIKSVIHQYHLDFSQTFENEYEK